MKKNISNFSKSSQNTSSLSEGHDSFASDRDCLSEFSTDSFDNTEEDDYDNAISEEDDYDYDIYDEDEDEEEYENDFWPRYNIVFGSEMLNGTLIFQIIYNGYDNSGKVKAYNECAGHVIVTKLGKIKILKSDFYIFCEDDRLYFRNKVKEFCKAAQIGKI